MFVLNFPKLFYVVHYTIAVKQDLFIVIFVNENKNSVSGESQSRFNFIKDGFDYADCC